MSVTRAAFRILCGSRIGAITTLTTTGQGTTDIIVCADLNDANPSGVEGLFVQVGTETRRVVQFDPTTGQAAVNRAFTGVIDSGTVFHLYRRFTPDEYNTALEQAIADVWPYLYTLVIDDSLTTVANQFSYPIPATIVELERMSGGQVQLEANTSLSTYPYRKLTTWRTEGRNILLDPVELIPNRTLRVIGLGHIPVPADDTDTIDFDTPELTLLVYMTIANLYGMQLGVPRGDTDHTVGLEGKYRQLFDMNKDAWGITLVPERLEELGYRHPLRLPLAYFATPGPTP